MGTILTRPAPGADLLGADDGFFVVIAAFDDHVWAQSLDDAQGSGLAKDHNCVDGRQRGKNASAFAFADNRAGRSLECANGSVAVDGDDEAVAFAARIFEESDVADMQQIETPVCEDNALARGAPG